MMELTKPPRSAAGRSSSSDPLDGGGGGDEEEAPGGIANMRVVNASKVTTRDTKGHALQKHFMVKQNSD